MSDTCEVRFSPAAEREFRRLAKQDPERAVTLAGLIEQVEENGWKLSTRSEAIKVLRNKTCIGEIRDVGSGGYRLFFFWDDTPITRDLWVCRIIPKRDVQGRRRLNDVCDAVEEQRKRFLNDRKKES